MITALQNRFAMTRQGAVDLIKASLWCMLTNFSLMIPPILMIQLIYRVLTPVLAGQPVVTNPWMWLAWALMAGTFIWIVYYFQYAATFVAVYKESAQRRLSFGERLRALPLSFFSRRDLSDLTNTFMGDCTSIESMFSHAVPQLFGFIGSFAIVTVMLINFNWKLALSVLWVIPASLLVLAAIRRMVRRREEKLFFARRHSADGFQEILETMKNLRACNREEKVLEDLEERLKDVERKQIGSELVFGIFVNAIQALLHMGLPTVVLVGAPMMLSGEIPFFIWLVYLLIAARLYEPLSMVLLFVAEMMIVQVAVDHMKEINATPLQQGSKDLPFPGGDLEFNNVSFSYGEDQSDQLVLKGVSFQAKQGQVTALVGPSGGGKTTATKLACRFWDAQSGVVSLGGVDVTTMDPEDLLCHYAIVFQDVVLFNDTVMENIRLGRKDASDEEVLEAAKMACCDEFVKRLPQGWQTVIGENGARLSGGERQRISIARALLKDAPIVLLDEATASLDVENESQIQKALMTLMKDKTVLVIAHRMRTVERADHVVVLAEGQVVEQGTPQELLKRQGFFARMVAFQKETANWSL